AQNRPNASASPFTSMIRSSAKRRPRNPSACSALKIIEMISFCWKRKTTITSEKRAANTNTTIAARCGLLRRVKPRAESDLKNASNPAPKAISLRIVSIQPNKPHCETCHCCDCVLDCILYSLKLLFKHQYPTRRDQQ